LSSSGHFVEGDDPKPFGMENMSQKEAEDRIIDFLKEEPLLSEIPIQTPENKLRVRHGGYDIHGAKTDPNVNFPITRLRELEDDGKSENCFTQHIHLSELVRKFGCKNIVRPDGSTCSMNTKLMPSCWYLSDQFAMCPWDISRD
jgi:hypothetical protein